MSDFKQQALEIVEAGKVLYRLGMVPATSGNFSARLADGTIAITVSGRHKGELTTDDIMRLDVAGKPLDDKKPSAEAGLHVQLYQHFPQINAILHPHMMNAIVLARRVGGDIYLKNYELLKALDGITTHETEVYIPVFANDQDIPRLAAKVQTFLETNTPAYAYIIDGHGIYTWGRSMADTLRHVEVLDYLFATELKLIHV
jgi:methylthioribulose-1-phosphate dehydratase